MVAHVSALRLGRTLRLCRCALQGYTPHDSAGPTATVADGTGTAALFLPYFGSPANLRAGPETGVSTRIIPTCKGMGALGDPIFFGLAPRNDKRPRVSPEALGQTAVLQARLTERLKHESTTPTPQETSCIVSPSGARYHGGQCAPAAGTIYPCAAAPGSRCPGS